VLYYEEIGGTYFSKRTVVARSSLSNVDRAIGMAARERHASAGHYTVPVQTPGYADRRMLGPRQQVYNSAPGAGARRGQTLRSTPPGDSSRRCSPNSTAVRCRTSRPCVSGCRARKLCFFEAYFSNHIEGTTFTVEEAEDIVLPRTDSGEPQRDHTTSWARSKPQPWHPGAISHHARRTIFLLWLR